MPLYGLTSGFVTAITMRNDAVFAFDEKYFQPLMTHSSPSLTARRRELRRVGAGVRFGHRVAREHLAVEQRLEVALLLLRRAVVGDDLRVAGVGRLAAEDDRRPLRPAEDLVQQRELELAVALATELGAEVRGPQLAGRAPLPSAGRRSCAACRRAARTARAGHSRSSGSTSSRTNVVDPVELLLELGVGLEVPRHCRAPLVDEYCLLL